MKKWLWYIDITCIIIIIILKTTKTSGSVDKMRERMQEQ